MAEMADSNQKMTKKGKPTTSQRLVVLQKLIPGLVLTARLRSCTRGKRDDAVSVSGVRGQRR